MVGLGKALRARAVALGLSDSEVARRLGMSQARYHNYVSDTAEPDLATLLRICRTLSTSPDEVLGFGAAPAIASEDDVQRSRMSSALSAMQGEALAYAADLLEAMVLIGRTRSSPASKARVAAEDGRSQPKSTARSRQQRG